MPYGGLKKGQLDFIGDGLGAEAARVLSRHFFLSYNLFPLQGKSTRPGVLDRNYDLDARCGPSSKPRDEPTQPPCPMLPGCLPACLAALPVPAGLSAAGQGVITLSRASARGPWAVYCFCAVLYSALPCHCHCHCRVWEFGNGRNVAMPSADFLGREAWVRDEAAGSDESFAASRLPAYYCIENVARPQWDFTVLCVVGLMMTLLTYSPICLVSSLHSSQGPPALWQD